MLRFRLMVKRGHRGYGPGPVDKVPLASSAPAILSTSNSIAPPVEQFWAGYQDLATSKMSFVAGVPELR